jgi:hypothetical protein
VVVKIVGGSTNSRDRRRTKVTSKNAKDVMLAGIKSGLTVKRACEAAERGTSTYAYYRKTDPNFRIMADAALQQRGGENTSLEVPDFPEFCEKYLNTKLFWHHLQWYDLLEGNAPRDLHSSQLFEQRDPDQILVNTPPDHPASLETPIFVRDRGWITVGEVETGDFVFHDRGQFYEVYDSWESSGDVDLFELELGTGERIKTSGEHKWIVQRSANHAEKQMSTAELMTDLRSASGRLKWRIRQAQPMDLPEQELFDPYLFGYWLGDGSADGSRFAVGGEDIDAFEAYLSSAGHTFRRSLDSRGKEPGGPWVVYVHRIRRHLPLGSKHIPAAYLRGSFKQRLELLKGLMDSDGTISKKDGRARWVQHGRSELCRDVSRLIASLGFQPRTKTYGPATEISFKPDAEPVFRLERKAARQFTRARNRRTDFVTIKDVRPAGRGPVRCLSVLSDDNTYAIGNGLIRTRNAKSTTLTINYVTWRIAQDPNVRILIISKTQDMAKKFLVAIKDRLSENEAYARLQADFGPPGGFAEGAARWAADAIYVSGRDSGEKDPTVQAVGIKGHIYGSRCDLAIMDDCVDHTNHQDYEKQIDWIQNQVSSRVADAGGRMLLVGTRMETTDLYSEIRKPSYYVDGESPWTYLKQPAVLEYADDPKDWKTLWPVTNRAPVSIKGRKVAEGEGWPKDGMWPAWPGTALAKKRRKMRARNWSMIYQQDQVADDSTFKQEDVQGCVDRARYPGRLMAGQSDHRVYGMDGLTVIAGLDPAAAGYTAIQVWGLDRQTKVRWVLEIVNKKALPPHLLREEMFRLTERYNVSEWRIEKNAYQASLVQERLIRDFMNARGVLIGPHTTDAKKWDSDFGVASMSTLFDGWQEGRNLIRLPSQTQSEPVRNFVEQLCAWTPETKGLTDCVMAAWFVEIRCRELMMDGLSSWHSENSEFMSQRDMEGQMVVDIEMALSQGEISSWDGSMRGFTGLN